MPAGVGARRVQGEELVGQVGDRVAHALLGPQPLRPTEPRKVRPLATGVARHPGDLLDRHEDPVARRERQLQVVALVPCPTPAEHLLVARDAVIDVDDEVARTQALQDVARHDPAEGLGSADPDRPEQFAVRDERDAVRSADEPAVEAPADEGDRAGGWRLGQSVDDGDRVIRLRQDLGQSGRLVAGQHDPVAVCLPDLDRVGDPSRAPEREDGLAPAEEIPGAPGSAGHRRIRRWLRLPGQLEGPRRHQAALPVARPEVRRCPVLGELRGLDQLRSPLVRLAPQEGAGLGDVRRLVEDEERAWIDVIERGGWRQDSRPDLGGVADVEGSRRLGGHRAQRIVGLALEAREVGREALAESARGPAESLADRGHARRRQEELRRGQEHGPVHRPRRPLVGRVEGAQ